MQVIKLRTRKAFQHMMAMLQIKSTAYLYSESYKFCISRYTISKIIREEKLGRGEINDWQIA